MLVNALLLTPKVSTHSRAEAAAANAFNAVAAFVFQHTAARRRLRPLILNNLDIKSFNTQPRGGGCIRHLL